MANCWISRRFFLLLGMLSPGLLGAEVPTGPSSQPPLNSMSVRAEEGPRLPMTLGSAAGATLDGRAVFVGGERWNAQRTVKSILPQIWVFDQGHWREDATLPLPMAECAFATDGKALYLAGGVKAVDHPTDAVFRLTWVQRHIRIEQLPPLPHPLDGGVGDILHGRFYITGGYVNGVPSNQTYCLDLANLSAGWRELAPLPATPRTFSALAACGDYLYLLGGLAGNESESNDTVPRRALSDVYRFDPAVNHWTAMGKLPVAGYAWSASGIDSNHLLLAGRGDGTMHDDIWIVSLSPLSARVEGHCVVASDCAALIRLNDTTWWLAGGEPDMNKHRTDQVTVISVRR